MTSDKLRPGSHESRRAGCRCHMSRNQYGLGAYIPGHGKPVYEVSPDCPLHAGAVSADDFVDPASQGSLL
jgi:hypothetical protein